MSVLPAANSDAAIFRIRIEQADSHSREARRNERETVMQDAGLSHRLHATGSLPASLGSAAATTAARVSSVRAIIPALAGRHAGVMNAAAITLWAAGVLDILTGGRMPAAVGIGASLLYITIALPAVNRASIAPILVAMGGVAAFSLPSGDPGPIAAGLSFATRLGAFLFSALMLRQTLAGSLSLANARARFSALPLTDQKGAALLTACVFGSVFSIATVILMAALIEGRSTQERRMFGPLLLCGMALSFLWSPFTIGMAFAMQLVPLPSMVRVMPLCLALGAVGLLAGIAFYSRFRLAVLRGACGAVAPLIAPLIILFGSVALVCFLFGQSMQAAIIVVTPPLCAAYLMRRGPAEIRTAVATTCGRSGRALADVLVFSAGLAFAVAVQRSGVLPVLVQAALDGHSVSFLLPGLALAIPLMSLAGLHTTTLATLVALVGLAVPGGSNPEIVFALTLIAWTAATMLSFSAVMVATTCREYDVPMRHVVLGRNVGVMAAVAAAGALIALAL